MYVVLVDRLSRGSLSSATHLSSTYPLDALLSFLELPPPPVVPPVPQRGMGETSCSPVAVGRWSSGEEGEAPSRITSAVDPSASVGRRDRFIPEFRDPVDETLLWRCVGVASPARRAASALRPSSGELYFSVVEPEAEVAERGDFLLSGTAAVEDGVLVDGRRSTIWTVDEVVLALRRPPLVEEYLPANTAVRGPLALGGRSISADAASAKDPLRMALLLWVTLLLLFSREATADGGRVEGRLLMLAVCVVEPTRTPLPPCDGTLLWIIAAAPLWERCW